MMKCTDVQKYLDDYLDGAMSLGEQNAVEAHIENCAFCQQELDACKSVRQALNALPVEEASADFEENVFSAVRRQYGRHGRHSGGRFAAGFATAIAASLALWFASTMYTPQFDEGEQHVVNLAMNQTRTVKLVFDAPKDLAEVTLKVELPENIELEGYAGKKQLVWQTSLVSGQNILALPIIATGNAQGELLAQLTYGDKTKQLHIVLRTGSNGALIYQIDKLKSA